MSKLQRERENFYRNSTVIVDIGKKVLSALLDNELSTLRITIIDFLNKHQHEIYHMCFNRKQCCLCVRGLLPSSVPDARVLRQDQLDVLFDKNAVKHPRHNTITGSQYCCSAAKAELATSCLDVTLLRFLLINFAGNCATGKQVRNAVENLVRFRNVLFGHAKEASISDNDYQQYRPEIEKCILQIAGICNIKGEIQHDLKDAYRRPLDEMVCLAFQNVLFNDMQRQGQREEDIKHIKSHATEMHNKLQSQIRDSANNLQDKLEACSRKVENKLEDMQLFCIDNDQGNTLRNKEIVKQIEETGIEVIYSRQAVLQKVQKSEVAICMQINDVKSCMQNQFKEITDHLEETSQQLIGNIKYTQRLIQESFTEARSMQAQTQDRIRNHKKDETLFETQTMSEATKYLENGNALVILGNEGSGKSTLVMHAARCLEEKNYVPILFLDQEIIQNRQVLSTRHKHLIIVEDLFGKTYDENIHKKCLDFLKSLVNAKPTVKVVVTIINTQIGQEDILKRHAFFDEAKIINLNGSVLSDKEKINILLNHMQRNCISRCESPCDDNISFDWEEIPKCNLCHEEVQTLSDGRLQLCTDAIYLIGFLDTHIGFPEMCRLFCSDPNNTLLGVNFFRKTTKTLANQLSDLFVAGMETVRPRYQYCLLLYMAMSEGCVHMETIESNFDDDPLFQELLGIFETSPVRLRKTLVKNALRELEGTFIINGLDYEKYHCSFDVSSVRNKYMLKTESINNSILFTYGTEFPEELLRLAACDITFIMNNIRPVANADIMMKGEHIICVPLPLLKEKLYRLLKMERGLYFFFKHFTLSGIKISTRREKQQEEKLTSTDEYGFGEEAHSLILQENVIEHEKFGMESETDLNAKSEKNGGVFHSHLCSTSEKVGAFLRKCLVEGYTKEIIVDFFENLDIVSLSPEQISNVLNGLSRKGTCSEMLAVKTDKITNIVFKYGSVKLICKLCRPKSNNHNLVSFYQIESSTMHNFIMTAVHRNAGYQIINEIGHYIDTISKENDHTAFVASVLNAIFKDYVNKKIECVQNVKYFLDGLFHCGRNPAAVLHNHRFPREHFGKICSMNLILALCEEREDTILFDHENHVYFQKTKPQFIEFMKRRVFFHIFLHDDVKSKVDFSIQTKILGNDLYKFTLKINDSDFTERLLLSIVNISIDMINSLELAEDMEKHFLTFLIKGFTNEDTRLTELQEKYPESLAQMQKHIDRYTIYMETGKDNILEAEHMPKDCLETIFEMLGFVDNDLE